MKILPVSCKYIPAIKRPSFGSDKVSVPEHGNLLAKIPAEFLRAQAPINQSQYIYRPVSSLKPNFEPIGHYDDLDKFSELYASKINSQLLTITENDIENLINRIKKATGADENQIREVLHNLTSFSNYRAFGKLSKLIANEGITSFGLPYSNFDFSSNSAIQYLIKSKRFANYPVADCVELEKPYYILDDISLSQLENYKNSSDKAERAAYDNFINDLDKYTFVVLKGWEIKTKENGYKGANMFYGSGYLESLALEVITRLQNGENPDEIYYSDFKERLYNLVEDEELKKQINILNFSEPSKPEDLTNQAILNSINSSVASKDYIKMIIESFLELKNTQYGKERTQEALLKYLDEMTVAYSVDSLSVALKKMGRNIESMLRFQGYSKDDISYIVPNNNRSYSLITLMYSQLNGINPKNINSTHRITQENLKKPKVILDDISASGVSEGKSCFDIRRNYRIGKTPIIYAPVVLCNQAEDYVSRPDVSLPNGYCFDKYIYDMSKTIKMVNNIIGSGIKIKPDLIKEKLEEHIKKSYKLLNYTDCLILTEILFPGYEENALCMISPYMIPDNASDIAGLVLRDLLTVKNDETDKAIRFLYNYRKNARKSYEDFLKIIMKIRQVEA